MNIVEKDVAVIGAGPVGLFAVFALGQVGLSSIVVDALHEAGGQCAALYPEKPIYDIPGRPMVTGRELIEDLLQQAAPYDPHYIFGQTVRNLSESHERFTLELGGGDILTVSSIIVAAGAGAFGPNRPPLTGIEAYEGKSVFYALRSPEKLRDKNVVIAGGGDSAVDWAILLTDIAASVTIVHRRPQFRAAPASLSELQRLHRLGRIRFSVPGTLNALSGKDGELVSVAVSDENGQTRDLRADALLCFFGLAKDLSALATWDIAADRSGVAVDPSTMQTKRPGIFAIGDIAHYPGKLKLILTGFAEAAAAAYAARSYLKPNQVFHFEYSTNRGQPGVGA